MDGNTSKRIENALAPNVWNELHKNVAGKTILLKEGNSYLIDMM